MYLYPDIRNIGYKLLRVQNPGFLYKTFSEHFDHLKDEVLNI